VISYRHLETSETYANPEHRHRISAITPLSCSPAFGHAAAAPGGSPTVIDVTCEICANTVYLRPLIENSSQKSLCNAQSMTAASRLTRSTPSTPLYAMKTTMSHKSEMVALVFYLLQRFAGPFSSSREKLDYSYHSNYEDDRRRLQDRIILNILKEQGRSSRKYTKQLSLCNASRWVAADTDITIPAHSFAIQ